MHGRNKAEHKNRSAEEKEATKVKVLKYKQLVTLALAKRQEGATPKDTTLALQLSGQLLRVNPDVSCLWNHRKEIILASKQVIQPQERGDGSSSPFEPLEHELGLVAECIQKNPKSYGAWHHRKWLLEKIKETVNGTPYEALFLKILDRELGLCARFLDADERNFHCWNYRRFVAQVHPRRSATDEFDFSTERIYKNFSNYSAFHHRATYIQARLQECNSGSSREEDEKRLIREELDMIQSAIFTEPDDQTAWWYHQYLIAWAARLHHHHHKKQQEEEEQAVDQSIDGSFLEEVLRREIEAIRGLLEEGDGTSYRWAMLTLASLLHRLSTLLAEKGQEEESRATLKESRDLYERLVELDPGHAQRYRSILSSSAFASR